MTSKRITVELRKVQPNAYHVHLRFQELWKAWRHGIDLPARRVSPVTPFSASATRTDTEVTGDEGGYVGQWTVPEGVTSVDIEVFGSEGTESDRT